MADQIVTAPPSAVPAPASVTPPGALRVSVEEYMERYAHDFYEWVEGKVIKMAPASVRHVLLGRYLSNLLEAYFALNPIGELREAPFLMIIEAVNARREPDLQIILKENPGQLTPTAMIGPADICIEIVSPESTARDRGKKFQEYEQGGVKEYWLFDPVRTEASFYRLTDQQVYVTILAGRTIRYETPLLPGLVIDAGLLWADRLPDFYQVGEAVKTMLKR